MARTSSPSTDPAPLTSTPRPIRRGPGPQPAPGGKDREPRTFNLDDVDPADAVVIDAQSYRLTRSGGLNLIEQAALSRAWKRLKRIGDKVQDGREPTAAELNEHRKLSEEMVRLALRDCPAEVVARLHDEQIARVILVFFARTSTASGLARTVEELLPRNPATSALTSRVSSGSTAETP